MVNPELFDWYRENYRLDSDTYSHVMQEGFHFFSGRPGSGTGSFPTQKGRLTWGLLAAAQEL